MATQEKEFNELLDEQEEYWDEEENGKYKNLKSVATTFKDAVVRAAGFGDRDQYGNTADYFSNHVLTHGIPGAIVGFAIAAFAVVSHIANVVISNVVFGQAKHLDFPRAIAEATGKSEIEKATKDEKNKSKERTGKNKEQSDKTKDKEPSQTKSEEEMPNEKDIVQFPHEIEPIPALVQEISNLCTPEVSDFIKEMEDNIDKLKADKASLDQAVAGALSDPTIKRFFKEFNLEPHIDHNSNQVLLFRTDAENNLEKIPFMRKEDLLDGNAQPFGSALYQENTKDDRDASMLAAAKAVVLSAKVKNEMFAGVMDDARKCMTSTSKDMAVLSYAITDCPNNSSGLLYTVLSATPESVDLYYKNTQIGTFDLREDFNNVADKVYEQMVKIDKEMESKEYSIGDSITFYKDSKDVVMVEVNGEGKTFPIACERDMKAIADYILEKCPEKAVTAQIDAMMIGAKMNPYMEKAIDENGYPVDPFTDKVLDKGDLFLKQEDGVPMICEYNLAVSTAIGMAGCTIEDIKEIAYVPTDGVSYQMDAIENKVSDYLAIPKEEEIPESLVCMNAAIFGPVEADASRPFDASMTTNGYVAYQQMKDAALLDGRDISEIQVTGYEECEYAEQTFESAEDLAREAEENLKNDPEMGKAEEYEEER